MAENVNITLNDGTTFQAPAWATEVTLNAILSAVDKLAGTSKEQKAALKQVAKDTADGKKVDEDLLKSILASEKQQKENGNFLKEIAKDNKSLVGSIGKFSAGVIGSMFTVAAAFTSLAKSMGNDIAGRDGGLALDVGGAMGDASLFSNAIRGLGISADDLTSKLENSASTIAVIGREQYFDMTAQVLKLTASGSEFGKTLAEMTDVLDEDLALQQSAGLLRFVQDGKQAQRSADLYERQLKSTAMLGKSIADIMGAGNDSITSNASIQLLLQSMGSSAQGFQTTIKAMTGEMMAGGLTQGLINAMTNASLETVAYSTDAGSELFTALATLDGVAGSSVAGMVQTINTLSKTDPKAAQEMMMNLDDELRKAAKGLDKKQLNDLRLLLEQQGPLAQQLGLSIGQMSSAVKKSAADFNDLAKASVIYDNALVAFGAALSGTGRNLTAAFALPMTHLADAFENSADFVEDDLGNTLSGTRGIFATLTNAMKTITAAFSGLFNGMDGAEGKFKNLTEFLRKKLNPMIETAATHIARWIEEFTVKDIERYIDNMVLAFETIAGIGSALASAFGWLAGAIVETAPQKDEDGNPTGKEIFNLTGTIRNALIAAVGYGLVKKAFGGLFSGAMTFGGAALSKIPGLGGLAGQGKTAAAAGKGFGAGASGMLAFGAAMAGIGVAVAGLAYSLETFSDMEWGEFWKAIGMLTIVMLPFSVAIIAAGIAGTAASPGLLAIGVALAGIGAAALGIGAGVGAAMAGISLLLDTPAENIAEQEAAVANAKELAEMDSSKLASTALGIESIAKAMVSFGDATNDGWFSGPDLDDQEKQLGIFEKFSQLNGTGLIAFTDGMEKLIETIEKLGDVDTKMLMANADAVEHLNKLTNRSFSTRVMDTMENAFNGKTSTPQPNQTAVNPIALSEDNPFVDNVANKNNPDTALLQQIVINTNKTQKAIISLEEKTT